MGRTKDILCTACGSFMTTVPIDVELDTTPICKTERCREENAKFYEDRFGPAPPDR